MQSRLLPLLLVVVVVAAALAGFTAAAASATTVQQPQDDSGLICDSSEAERGLILERALGALRKEFGVERGNLSFHLGGNPQVRALWFFGLSCFGWRRRRV